MLAATATDLINAKALIADPNKWGQDYYAMDDEGEPVDIQSEVAVCYCTMGAVYKALGMEEASTDELELTIRMFQCEKALEASVPINAGGRTQSVVAFNDDPDTTHDDVMALYDRAIARCNNGETDA